MAFRDFGRDKEKLEREYRKLNDALSERAGRDLSPRGGPGGLQDRLPTRTPGGGMQAPPPRSPGGIDEGRRAGRRPEPGGGQYGYGRAMESSIPKWQETMDEAQQMSGQMPLLPTGDAGPSPGTHLQVNTSQGANPQWRQDVERTGAAVGAVPTTSGKATDFRGSVDSERDRLRSLGADAQKGQDWRGQMDVARGRIDAAAGTTRGAEGIQDWQPAFEKAQQMHADSLQGQFSQSYADEAAGMRRAANANTQLGPGASGAMGAAAAQVGLGGMQQRQQALNEWQQRGVDLQTALAGQQAQDATAGRERNLKRGLAQLDVTADLEGRGVDTAFGSQESELGREHALETQRRGDLSGLGQQDADLSYRADESQQDRLFRGDEAARDRAQQLGMFTAGQQFQGDEAEAGRVQERALTAENLAADQRRAVEDKEFRAGQERRQEGLKLRMAELEMQWRSAEASGDRELQMQLQEEINNAAREMTYIEGVLGADMATLEYLDGNEGGGGGASGESGGGYGGSDLNFSDAAKGGGRDYLQFLKDSTGQLKDWASRGGSSVQDALNDSASWVRGRF